MRRREFITYIGGAVATWPLAVRAQQRALPVVGLISTGTPVQSAPLLAAFHRGLGENGYVDGRNVTIEYRWVGGLYDQLPALSAELVHLQVAVIAAFTPPAALAAKAATATIPIVFMSGTDPVKLGLVASLNRPGGNVTGATFFTTGLEPKWLELLHELAPNVTPIAVLVNPNFPEVETQLNELSMAARAIGLEIAILRASSESGIDAAFTNLVEQRIGALLVASDPFFYNQRDRLVALAAHHAIPAIYQLREYAVAGGLMSYGTSLADAGRQTGIYVGRVLKGDKPADLPVTRPTKFEFVINLKTLKLRRKDDEARTRVDRQALILSSAMIASKSLSPSRPCAATIPSSARCARNAFITWVRCRVSKSRARC
jgi:putative ABC transport system substrate-binding protein